MYLNKAIVIGNLTRDPELRSLPSGIKVCTFSLATNRVWKDKDWRAPRSDGLSQCGGFRTPSGNSRAIYEKRKFYISGRQNADAELG